MPTWTVFVKGDGTYTFNLDRPPDVILTRELKQMVATKTGLAVEYQRLIYAGKQLQDSIALNEYMIHNQSTIHLVQHLRGGGNQASQIESGPFQAVNRLDESTIHLVQNVQGGDSQASQIESQPFQAVNRLLPSHLKKTGDLCTLCYETPSLQLPCSHPYCSDCVAVHAWNEASQTAKLRSEVRCCQCNTEWSFKVLKEYGAMTQEEVQLLADCLSHNYLRDPEKFIQCPYCECYCERSDKNNPRVHCHFCQEKGEFCWHCKKAWENGKSSTKCSHCSDDEVLNDIRNAPKKEVVGVLCPSLRLCPGCGVITEHRDACKQMKCEMCNMEFCFICLRTKQGGSWSCGSYDYKCPPAPVQQVVPRK